MTAHVFRLIGGLALGVLTWAVAVAGVATLVALVNAAAWRFAEWAVYVAGAALLVFLLALAGEFLTDPEARR